MKRAGKIVLLILLVALFVEGIPQVNAQINSGIRAGLNFSDITELQPKSNNGFHVGTYLKISLAGLMTLEPAIQYSVRKFQSHPDYPTSKVSLKYIDVPLILRVGVLPFVNVFVGPQASVLLSRKYSGDGNFDAIGSLPKQELGGVTGIGVKLPLGINVQGSYDFGLSHLEHNGHKVKNKVFKISLGKDF